MFPTWDKLYRMTLTGSDTRWSTVTETSRNWRSDNCGGQVVVKYSSLHCFMDWREGEWFTLTLTLPNPITHSCSHHKKVVVDRHNSREWLFTVDPQDPTRYIPADDGDVFEKQKPDTRTKYTEEDRGLFGVMMRQGGDGEDPLVGEWMTPFSYTGGKVVGPVTYENSFWAEVNCVNTLKTTGTTRYVP